MKIPENVWLCGIFRGYKMVTLARDWWSKYGSESNDGQDLIKKPVWPAFIKKTCYLLEFVAKDALRILTWF